MPQFANFYIHTPYCETKCHYCDFFSLPEAQHNPNDRARIYDAIVGEVDLNKSALSKSAATVFFGGGTPSLAPLEVMQQLIERLPINTTTEVTMEANPSSITAERAHAWRAMGINRISMGMQALNDERLSWLGRVHDSAGIFRALETLFEAGFERISVDYIVGVPGQTLELIRSEIESLLNRFPKIKHMSAYLLTLKTSNPKFTQLPDDDEQLAHLRTIRDVLGNRGFEQYEISNFAHPGARALHNENYWLGGGYLGIGPSAHSYWPWLKRRSKNWASLGKYSEMIANRNVPIEWDESLSDEQLRLEHIMLRLRRQDGLNLSEYETRFGRKLYSENQGWIDASIKRGVCELKGDHLRLVGDGFFLSDEIISKIS